MTAAGVRQLSIAAILARRDLSAKLGSIWIYGLASAICAMTALLATGFRRTFETETISVSADPLAPVHGIVLVILALVLGMRAAISLSWERENRTMDVLLSGPATASALVAAKLATELVTLVMLGLVYSAYLILVRPVGDLDTALGGAASFWRLSVLVLPMIGLGLVISAGAGSVRSAVIVFLSVVLALATLEGASAWLDAQDPSELSLMAVYLRGLLSRATDWLDPVSPVAYLAEVAHNVAGGAAPAIVRLVSGIVLLIALTVASVLLVRTRGAGP
jgi:ABC-type transport system involved in multi-copper enzyme maturation permease subunit